MDLHAATEKYLYQCPPIISQDRLAENLKQHMLLAQDVPTEDKLSEQRRTGLMVRRIQNMLVLNPKGFILKENIFKQGEKVNKKTSKRLVTLDAQRLQWYHDDSELQADKYLGSIELRFIYNVIKSYQDHNTMPAFMLGVTMWTDKKKEEKGRREFFFGCHNELERDKWMIAIEFLKTKAVYDAYSLKNSNVNFTINQKVEGETNEEEEHRMDMASLLYDFGSNLKNETRQFKKTNAKNLAPNMGNLAQALSTM